MLFAQGEPVGTAHGKQGGRGVKFRYKGGRGETVPRTGFEAVIASINLIIHLLDLCGRNVSVMFDGKVGEASFGTERVGGL